MPTYSTGAAGVPTSRKLPGVYTQVVLGQGPGTAGGGPLKLLLLGNKTSAGSATVDTVIYDNLTPETSTSLFGQGSELALMAIAATTNEPGATVSAIAVTESGGVKATATLTVSGAAGGAGTVYVTIHGVTVQASINAGDNQNTAGATIAAAINSFGPQLCVTAASVSGVVTLTYRHNGPRGNGVILKVSNDATITTQTYTLSGNLGSAVSGTTQDTLTAALSTAGVRRWDYVACANTDQTAITAIQAKLQSQNGPLVRKRGQGVVCLAGPVAISALATCTTLAQAVNDAIMQILWFKLGENLPGVIAASWAATRSVLEQAEPNIHLSRMNPTAVDLWPWVTAPTSSADYITETEAEAALGVGLTPIEIRPDKHPQIALSITSHSQDSFGAPDTRVLTTNMVSVPFAWADIVESLITTQFAGFNLLDDPVDGNIQNLPPKTVTPSLLKGFIVNVFKDPRGFGRFVGSVDEDVATWAFNLDATNQNRMDATMQLHPLRWFTQFSSQIRQI